MLLELSLNVQLIIAAGIGLLAAFLYGLQRKIDTDRHVDGIDIFIYTVFGLIVGAANLGIWREPTGVSISAYFFVIAIWLTLNRRKFPKVAASAILIATGFAIFVIKVMHAGLKVSASPIAASIFFGIAVIALLRATVTYINKGSSSDQRR